eukprot:TRINITY_DN11211_c0_g1_i1.p1 TRINITY_DN11211_c0_g1~~TRINITY_DN11211_c0_g1_i1.p1  ORF type:complete len:683 (-),score=189.29 TRINITY_DN11211_c0_g1_i1:586-2634(-)
MSDDTHVRKRLQVSKACVPCRQRHLACEVQRPCQRCLRMGQPEMCCDLPRKKRPAKAKGQPAQSSLPVALQSSRSSDSLASSSANRAASPASSGSSPGTPTVAGSPVPWRSASDLDSSVGSYKQQHDPFGAVAASSASAFPSASAFRSDTASAYPAFGFRSDPASTLAGFGDLLDMPLGPTGETTFASASAAFLGSSVPSAGMFMGTSPAVPAVDGCMDYGQYPAMPTFPHSVYPSTPSGSGAPTSFPASADAHMLRSSGLHAPAEFPEFPFLHPSSSADLFGAGPDVSLSSSWPSAVTMSADRSRRGGDVRMQSSLSFDGAMLGHSSFGPFGNPFETTLPGNDWQAQFAEALALEFGPPHPAAPPTSSAASAALLASSSSNSAASAPFLASSSSGLSTMLETAEAALARGDYDSAILIASEMDQEPRTWTLLADAYSRSMNLDGHSSSDDAPAASTALPRPPQAQPAALCSSALQSTHLPTVLRAAEMSRLRGELGTAVQLASHALTLDPTSIPALCLRAECRTDERQHKLAVEDGLHALELDQHSPAALRCLARAFKAKKSYVKAVEYATRAVDLVTTDIVALAIRTESLAKLKAYHLCKEDAETVLSAQPNNLDALLTLANSCFKLQLFEESIQYCKRVLHMFPAHDKATRCLDKAVRRLQELCTDQWQSEGSPNQLLA